MSELLRLDSVRFGWDRSREVINIKSLSINQGQHTFIMGISGSGKSTLLNLIGGILQPQHGTIVLNDIEVSSRRAPDRDQIRANTIGFVFQQFNLIPYLSAIENVLLSCQFSLERRNNAVRRQGSEKKAAENLLFGFFKQNRPNFDHPVSTLSVGQQQRVAAARALIGSPALIIADEPTSALDHDTRHQFMSLLLEEANHQGSTVLFVSHDPTLASRFAAVHNMSDFNAAPLK